MSLERIRKFILEQMPVIDEIIAHRSTPLNRRVLEATILFVSECVIEITGRSNDDIWKGNPWEEQWFRDIYQMTEAWYAERYGDAIRTKSSDWAAGLIVLYGTPFRITVPLSIVTPEKPGETAWVTFPDSVLPDEDMLSWLETPPNLESISDEDKRGLEKQIHEVASSLRSINLNLMTATYSSSSLERLGGSIRAHLAKAVEDIVSLDIDQMSLAFWELHLAVEKTIKVLLRQDGIQRRSHKLEELVKLCCPSDGLKAMAPLLAIFPKETEAIEYRYGERDDIKLERAVSVYRTALALVKGYSNSLKRDISMNNARFLIRAVPWKRAHFRP